MRVQNNFKTIGLAAVFALSCSGQSLAEGNRYDLPREYVSEISPAKAYLEMKKEESILIDVRRLREYAAGHPEKAFNVPFPHKVDSNDQTASTAYWAVYNLVGGDVDTPINTLCRTGARSVRLANILADPLNTANDPARVAVPGGIPFTNVRNIWEGFVGQHKEPYNSSDPTNKTFLDLNNNGVIDSDVADVYSHTTDANPDKDGWRNYQQLPWNTKLHVNRVYLNDRSLYDDFVE